MGYDSNWYAGHRQWDNELSGVFYGALGIHGFKSALDLGCGSELMGILAKSANVEYLGVEGEKEFLNHVIDKTNYLIHDLSKPMYLSRKYEAVFCLEVAEHLPPEAADTLVENIVRGSSKYIFFSAAQPGQGGYQHLNEQLPSFWRNKIESSRIRFMPVDTLELSRHYKRVAPQAMWYANNIQVFQWVS